MLDAVAFDEAVRIECPKCHARYPADDYEWSVNLHGKGRSKLVMLSELLDECGNHRFQTSIKRKLSRNPEFPQIVKGKKRKEKIEEYGNKGYAVYFVQAGENGPIKMGIAKWISLKQRIAGMQTDNAMPLFVRGTIDGSLLLEATLHKSFKHLCIGGEWFWPEKDLMEYIETHC